MTTFEADCLAFFDGYVQSYRVGDAAGCGSIYSEDAVLYSPYGPTARGRDAIVALHEEWLQDDTSTKEIRVKTAFSTGSDGVCVAVFAENGLDEGVSFNVLRADGDGGWEIVESSLNEL